MKQLLGWGVALVAVAAVMGVLHFAGFLIGNTLSWVALAVFVVGVILMIASTAHPRRRYAQA